MLKKLSLTAALTLLICSLNCCNKQEPEIKPMELVPTDVKVAIFPNQDLFGQICKDSYLEPNLVRQSGSVLFYDNNSRWYTAAMTSTKDMMEYLVQNTASSSNVDNVDCYSLNGTSYFILSNQLWVTNLRNATTQDLFSVIDRARKSSLSSIKIVSRLQSETANDSILAVSKEYSNPLMLPADAWLCGRAAYSNSHVERGWIQAFSPSGNEYPLLDMLSPIDPQLLSYLPCNCVRVYGAGCSQVNWQSMADHFSPQLPFALKAMMSSIVKCLQQIDGTVVCGVTADNLQVLVVQTKSPQELMTMVQERLARVGLQNVMNLYAVGDVLVASNRNYNATPTENRFQQQLPQGAKAAMMVVNPNNSDFDNAFLVGNRVYIKGIF